MSQALSTVAALSPASLHTLAAPTVGGVLTNLGTEVKVIGLALAGLMIVVLGIKVIISMKGGQSLREAIQNLGVLGLGVAIIVSGAVILTIIQGLATNTLK
ncbi:MULTISPECIES: hypothetical protein [Streptomycetaceae]|uniref:hypothetical protein n=1 Tax=Streptomycetaceae TaxID=2062 RepID=UPI00139B739E|nr:hypothetical protein [Streptomyces sp.]MCZ0984311.1 hypothetical protein [Streptomyces diastatochromogenes]MYT20097.1 hypothetical protein [Streptomyces sp. SID7760]HWU11064.1 hypothetical protein [Streptomyces sp.]